MDVYKHIFYRVYERSIKKKWDNPKLNGLLIISFLFFTNALLIIGVFQFVTDLHILGFLIENKIITALLFILILVTFYCAFYVPRRFKAIQDTFERLDNIKKTKLDKAAILYIIASILLLISTPILYNELMKAHQ